ncbi:MAG: C2H2-type zinc finger protein [Zetaproteobacteria bacterium]|nr:C2H2-type zinc finger protein [Zetaproteobacteria bacterium]
MKCHKLLIPAFFWSIVSFANESPHFDSTNQELNEFFLQLEQEETPLIFQPDETTIRPSLEELCMVTAVETTPESDTPNIAHTPCAHVSDVLSQPTVHSPVVATTEGSTTNLHSGEATTPALITYPTEIAPPGTLRVCTTSIAPQFSVIGEKDQDECHPEDRFEHYPCNYPNCGKIFKKRYNRKAHIRVHTDKHKYACKLCSKTFKWKSSIKSHIHWHNKQTQLTTKDHLPVIVPKPF